MLIPDRQKQRREYLWQKTFLQFKIKGISLLGLCLLIATVLSLLFTSICFLPIDELHPLMLISAFVSLFGGLACLQIQKLVERVSSEESDLVYVPPVTPNTLPAEEILVRASQEPEKEQRTVLLRAAGSAAIPAEELMRASVGNQKEA